MSPEPLRGTRRRVEVGTGDGEVVWCTDTGQRRWLGTRGPTNRRGGGSTRDGSLPGLHTPLTPGLGRSGSPWFSTTCGCVATGRNETGLSTPDTGAQLPSVDDRGICLVSVFCRGSVHSSLLFGGVRGPETGQGTGVNLSFLLASGPFCRRSSGLRGFGG